MSLFSKGATDEYRTPADVIRKIIGFIPAGSIVWESAFMDEDQETTRCLRDAGFEFVSEPIDFFTWEPDEWSIQITNPPFSQKKEWLERSKVLGKPFIILLPAQTLYTKYFRELFEFERIQLIIPKQRVVFKSKDGASCLRPCFESLFFCWKLELAKDILYV
jgi:hypothetical protein